MVQVTRFRVLSIPILYNLVLLSIFFVFESLNLSVPMVNLNFFLFRGVNCDSSYSRIAKKLNTNNLVCQPKCGNMNNRFEKWQVIKLNDEYHIINLFIYNSG